jgi:predicted aspartyl protease
MKNTKYINTILNNEYNVKFKLEFFKDKINGKINGILTAPYVKWFDENKSYVTNRVVYIKGDVLNCIEKYYFDKNVHTIPIQNYKNNIDMCDIVYNILPKNIYNKMISGNFKISQKADKNIYSEYFKNYKLVTVLWSNKKITNIILNENNKSFKYIKISSYIKLPLYSNLKGKIINIRNASNNEISKYKIHQNYEIYNKNTCISNRNIKNNKILLHT